jgi:hypothetical protein
MLKLLDKGDVTLGAIRSMNEKKDELLAAFPGYPGERGERDER